MIIGLEESSVVVGNAPFGRKALLPIEPLSHGIPHERRSGLSLGLGRLIDGCECRWREGNAQLRSASLVSRA